MFLPGFDPKSFSDEELLDRAAELNRRIVWATRFASHDMAAQLRQQKVIIEMEQRERLFMARMAPRMNDSPVVVETDPDLAAKARAERDAEQAAATAASKPARKPFAITKERVGRTSRPTDDER